MPKKRASLDSDEAVRRTKLIAPLLATDTWFALRARATLHAANDVVSDDRFNRPTPFGDTFNVTQNSLALTVALALARLFDVSDPDRYPIELQDKASIPVLAHLLMRKDVQESLTRDARGWHPQLIDGAELGEASCQDAFSSALALHEMYVNSESYQDAQSRLRSFRTGRLAHHLFDDPPSDLPRFDDLDTLGDFAKRFARAAVLAVVGHDRDLNHEEEIKSKMDRKFWDVALSAALIANK
ncbi:hypothetical protein IC762_03980 [Bradyrhizobium genosp. L]|uniref:hypothetical protein n=1 Tax=Bradyrhizobium genosp. L TaxID=83637 RepID=UPI0018A2CBD9|nr:hypothetical protein [Bradyrhizobium genosp. L]QPF85501.1 hypothetical protein IC762_03980 [Bradyrhizobium genosp. L]